MSWLYFLSFKWGSWSRAVIRSLLLAGIFFLFLSLSALAQTVYVKGSVVNVRLGPSTKYKVIAQLTKGYPVKIVGSQDNWYFIEFGDERGWIYGKLVASWKKINLSYFSLDKVQPAWVNLFKDVSPGKVILKRNQFVPLNQVRIINPLPLRIKDVSLGVVEGETENLLSVNITVEGMPLIERLDEQLAPGKVSLNFKSLIFQESIDLPVRHIITWNQEIDSQSIEPKKTVEIFLVGRPDFSEVVLSEKTKVLILVYSPDLVLSAGAPPAEYYLWGAQVVELPGLFTLVNGQEEKW